MTRVKICCIGSVEEAQRAVHHGASAIGLVGEMPSGPGVIPESLIAKIAAWVPPPIATFLLTSRTSAAEIIAQQRQCRVNTIQLCDLVSTQVHKELREALPGVSVVQVVHVSDEGSVAEALRVSANVDALLLDSGNPAKSVKELGGTGRTHNWSLSARIVREVPVPVILAGGLNAANVGEAIRVVQPFGVDLCTGVRTSGALDDAKLSVFMSAVSGAG